MIETVVMRATERDVVVRIVRHTTSISKNPKAVRGLIVIECPVQLITSSAFCTRCRVAADLTYTIVNSLVLRVDVRGLVLASVAAGFAPEGCTMRAVLRMLAARTSYFRIRRRITRLTEWPRHSRPRDERTVPCHCLSTPDLRHRPRCNGARNAHARRWNLRLDRTTESIDSRHTPR